MSDKQYQDATMYLQIEPVWGRYAYGGEKPLQGAKAITLTQTKPSRPKGGTVLIKLTVRVPSAAFLPLRPEAVVVIPEDMIVTNAIEVTAGDPE